MDKKNWLRYFTIFMILAFVGEIVVIGIGFNKADGGRSVTPTPYAAKIFSGQGTVSARVVSLSSQFLANCNTSNASAALESVRAIKGVQTAVFDQAGLIFALNKTGDANDSQRAIGLAFDAIQEKCEDGFTLYRIGYTVPEAQVTVTNQSGESLNVSNYTIQSYAQSVSIPGIPTLLDFRHKENDSAPVALSIETINSQPRRVVAEEQLFSPQAFFQGAGEAIGKVVSVLPRLIVTCRADENKSAEIPAILQSVNGTGQVSPDASGTYSLSYSNETDAGRIISEIRSKLGFCQQPGPGISRIGFLLPENGSACQPGEFNETGRTGFVGGGFDTGQDCKYISFDRMLASAAGQNLPAIPAALGVETKTNDTAKARITIAMANGRITSLYAEEEGKGAGIGAG